MKLFVMGESQPIMILGRFTEQRNYDRYEVDKSEPEPLTEEEIKRLSELVSIVHSNGTTSVLSPDQLKEYEELGERSNLLDAKKRKLILPNAIEPWVTASDNNTIIIPSDRRSPL